MNGGRTSVAPRELASAYVSRMERHLAQLAQGHDPFGHLFAVERLARAARAEWWAGERDAERGKQGR
jgi:hypothetical protein